MTILNLARKTDCILFVNRSGCLTLITKEVCFVVSTRVHWLHKVFLNPTREDLAIARTATVSTWLLLSGVAHNVLYKNLFESKSLNL